MKEREALLDNISNFDDEFASKYLDGADFTKQDLILIIRNIVNKFPL